MKKLAFILVCLSFSFISCSQKIPDKEIQIAQALLGLPEDFRANATVLGYVSSMDLEVIRQGSNSMICFADNPEKEGFSVAGYHKDLEPFMKRGRELKKQGKNQSEVFDIRSQEMDEGILKIPTGSTLYVTSGDFNESMEPVNLYQRFVVYIPYATEESSGLATSPSYPGGPWIMHPGTHRSHIMINPSPVEQ